MEEIVNKVAQSGLKTIDLAQFIPNEQAVIFDIKDFLWQELILKEKDFRSALKDFDWSSMNGKAVAIICSADAIVPTWAFMLVASHLQKNGIKHIVGSKDELSKMLIKSKIEELNPSDFTNERVIVKGCADIAVPNYAMTYLVTYLQNEVKSLMYGEPCSTVPIYKAPRK
mgnify:CR=1 FL=1